MGNNAGYDKHIVSVFKFAKIGDIANALRMIDMMKIAYEDKKTTLTQVKAKILLGMGEDDEFQLDSKIKHELIETYDKNLKVIKNYEYCYGTVYDELQWFVLYSSQEYVIAINEKSKVLRVYDFVNANYDVSEFADRPVYVEKLILKRQMKWLFEAVERKSVSAIYLGFDDVDMQVFLQISDISDMISKRVFIFLVGEEGVRGCFSDNFFPFPTKLFNITKDNLIYLDLLDEIKERKASELDNNIRRIADVYKREKQERDERIMSGHPRILFWAAIDSYTIPYQARDEYYAATLLDCECYYMIEPDFINCITPRAFAEIILDFRPDIIFDMNRFRFENQMKIPDEIIYVTWIQDPWPNILDIAAKGKLKHRDLLFNHLSNYQDIVDIYGDLLIEAPIPASKYVYKPYDLSPIEYDKYGADICLVCMCTDPEGYINELIQIYEDQNKDLNFIDTARKVMLDYRNLAEEGNFFYSKQEFISFINSRFEEAGHSICYENLADLADKMSMWYNQKLFRSILVDWLLEAGFSNIKLWGSGWNNSPRYARYAMGVAENGEVLSKIYQASKIVLGNNIVTTAAARVWECMLSGGFYLSNYIPPECDVCDIRNYMSDGSFEMFHNKAELIEKVHFYLENDTAREAMAKKGREEALNRMTYDVLMKKLIDVAPKYL